MDLHNDDGEVGLFGCDSDSEEHADKRARTEPLAPPGLSFYKIGLQYILSKAVVAEVTYQPHDPEMAKEVTLKIENVDRLDGEVWTTEARIRREWFLHASEWPQQRTAIFRGNTARQLAPMVEAAIEVSTPSYSKIVLETFFGAALRNLNPSPNFGANASEYVAWHVRQREIETMLNKSDALMASTQTTEISRLYNNRRCGRDVVTRGPKWDFHVEYIAAARKPAGDEDLDLPKAMLALWVYTVQLDAWPTLINGDKTAMRNEVLLLEREFRPAFAKTYGIRLVDDGAKKNMYVDAHKATKTVKR
jgi:hypothetical protein